MKKWWYVVVACAVLTASPRAFQSASTWKVGDPAPDFSFVGTDGKTYATADYAGKFVAIVWFRKAMSTGCTAELHSLMESAAALKAFDVTVLVASVDTLELNKQFAERDKPDFPLLSDPDKKVAGAYSVLGPTGLTANRWTFYIGADGKFVKIDTRVNTLTAGPDMVKILTDLGAPKKLSSPLGFPPAP